MQNVYNLAVNYREAIEAAVDSGKLLILPFYKFPKECCDMTCELLSRYFFEHGIRTELVIGAHMNDSQWHHVWIKTTAGIIVDITGDQFNKIPNMPSDIPAVYVSTQESALQKIFCQCRVNEIPMDFTESVYDSLGVPIKRKQDLRNAYDIINQYLHE